MVGTKGHKVVENIPPEEVVKKVLQAAKTLPEKLLVYGLIYTGMRIGELVHMRKNWLRWNLNPPRIFIPYRQSCSCRHCVKARYKRNKKTGDAVLVKPENTWQAKTEKAKRAVVVPPGLTPILKEFFVKHQSVMEVIPYREIAWYMLKRIAKRARVSWRLFPHLLRGVFASKLATQGVDVYRLKSKMGWKNFDMAMKYVEIYGPVKEEEIVEW
jgi:site-specific recombinase XerD